MRFEWPSCRYRSFHLVPPHLPPNSSWHPSTLRTTNRFQIFRTSFWCWRKTNTKANQLKIWINLYFCWLCKTHLSQETCKKYCLKFGGSVRPHCLNINLMMRKECVVCRLIAVSIVSNSSFHLISSTSIWTESCGKIRKNWRPLKWNQFDKSQNRKCYQVKIQRG